MGQREVSAAFLQSVKSIVGQLDRDAIVAALEAGLGSDVERAVETILVDRPYRRLAGALSRELLQPTPTDTQSLVVDLADPRTVAWAREYQVGLERVLVQSTRESLRLALARHVRDSLTPDVSADHVMRTIGLAPSQETAVANYRRMLETRDAEVLARRLADRRFRMTGLSEQKIDMMSRRYAEKFLRYRAAVLARTEYHRVREAAHWLAGLDAGGVRRHWVYVHDDRTRHAHRTIPSLNPDGVGVNEPFESELGPIMFPGDPRAVLANTVNCRCRVELRDV